MSKNPLKEIGEFGLIEQIQTWFGETVGDLEAIGDDCTVIPRGNQSMDLVTTDLLIEGTHFLFEKIKPEDLGYKSLAVNLSDIAAMGGRPKSVWVSIGLTNRADLRWLELFFQSMHQLAHEHNVRLMGGDTTKSQQHMVINIMVQGEATPDQVKYRSSARPGDVVFVTAPLGDSGGGLQLLLDDRKDQAGHNEKKLIRSHNRPYPFVNEGIWLGNQTAVHALIDLSDGISSDAGHVANRSGVIIDIELADLPISNALIEASTKHGWDAVNLASSAGEDYVLLGTCDPSSWQSMKKSYSETFHSDMYAVGHVRDRTKNQNRAGSKTAGLTTGGQLRFLKDGKPVDYESHGFDHFRSHTGKA